MGTIATDWFGQPELLILTNIYTTHKELEKGDAGLSTAVSKAKNALLNLTLTYIVLALNPDSVSHTAQHERQKSKEMKMAERLRGE